MTTDGSKSFSVLKSELAVQILKHIASEGNKDYGSNIAEDLGKPQTSICRVLTDLHEKGFVEKTSRERAQYYSVDFEGISDYWYSTLKSQLEEVEDGDKWLDELEDNSEGAKKALKKFLKELLTSDRNLEDQNIYQLIFDNFVCSGLHMLREDREFFKKRPGIHKAMIATGFVRHEKGFPEVMKRAMKEMEDR